jgi:hypothetical protein
MAVTAFASGTQTATIGTEHTLASVNAAGVYRLRVDTVNMTITDALELRVKSKALTAGTLRGEDVVLYTGVQPTDQLVKRSETYETDLAETDGLTFTLKQTAGTGRAFPWCVTRVS